MKTIQLTQGKVAIVDDEDFDLVSQFNWYYHDMGYAARGPNKKTSETRMHRLLLKPERGYHVDHKNGNGLDNRRENLRICTPSQNQMNKGMERDNATGVKGVTLTRSGKFNAQITLNGHTKYLGTFFDKLEAARAYQKAAARLFGEFAYHLNRSDTRTSIRCVCACTSRPCGIITSNY